MSDRIEAGARAAYLESTVGHADALAWEGLSDDARATWTRCFAEGLKAADAAALAGAEGVPKRLLEMGGVFRYDAGPEDFEVAELLEQAAATIQAHAGWIAELEEALGWFVKHADITPFSGEGIKFVVRREKLQRARAILSKDKT